MAAAALALAAARAALPGTGFAGLGPATLQRQPSSRAMPGAPSPELATRLYASGSIMEDSIIEEAPPQDERSEGTDSMQQLFDRWNTRGGSIAATVLSLAFAFGLEKVIEGAGVDPLVAGQTVTAILSVGLCIWTGQYFFRVATKSTTYAQQLRDYEQEVMLKRLSELDDDEIEALCAEVGVSGEELSDTVGMKEDRLKKLSQKEQVIEIFRAQMGASAVPVDPRASL